MIEIRIPKVGMSTVEVEVTELPIAVGDSVSVGDEIMVVAADKIDLTIESEHVGVLSELLVQVGDVVDVGTIVARLDEG
jgi:pyruvate/2-oxoglutarate dehydrogenase complex dihydrolipoamide acyltransferase (E2) component